MSSFSNYTEDKVLDQIFGGTAWTPPATLFFALSSTDPGEAGAGITEPVAAGYARIGVTNNATNFPASAAGAKANGTAIEFAASTGAWLAGASLAFFAIFDAVTAGNMIGYGPNTTAQAVTATGQIIRYAIGDMDITLT